MGNTTLIASNKVITLASGVTANAAQEKVYKASLYTFFVATVTGTGAVTATIAIEGSNDGVVWCSTDLATITLSATTTHTDGGTVISPCKWVRSNITNITGTGATVEVTMGY